MSLRTAFFAFSLLARALTLQSSPLVVKTLNGSIQGSFCSGETGARQFLSIPYAQPPIRFSAPQPYNASYNGTLSALTPAPSCPQFGAFFIESNPQSEDCLFLDIWTPTNVTISSKLPVKVWIFGGADSAGGITNATYNGCNIATDAIIVSVNYRVGPLGWLALPSAGIMGNFGLQDQLLALQWVQDNIESFGGNKDQILLFGQSAGAINAYALSSLPQAPSLIKAVILESGGGKTYKTVQAVQPIVASIVESLGCNVTDASCLRGASLTEWNQSLPHVVVPPAGTLTLNVSVIFGPLVDCNVLPAQPNDVGTQVPAIFGSNSNDGTLFVYTYFPRPNISSSDYNQFLNQNFLSAAPLVKARFPLVDSSEAFQIMSNIVTEAGFRCPAARGARLASSRGSPAWTYSFNHTPSCGWYPGITNNPVELKTLGSAHSAEIPFVFGLTKNLPPPDGNCSFDVAEKQLSAQMAAIWTSMAANGNPGSSVDWPKFVASQSMGVNIENEIVAGYVNYTACDFWDNVNNIMANEVLENSPAACSSRPASPTPLPIANEAGNAAVGRGWLAESVTVSILFALLLT